MNSKNKKAPTADESRHIERIKNMPCVICQASPPSDCHEPEQGLWFASIPLCRDCHTGSHNGIHGRKAIWNVFKMDEMRALAATVRALVA